MTNDAKVTADHKDLALELLFDMPNYLTFGLRGVVRERIAQALANEREAGRKEERERIAKAVPEPEMDRDRYADGWNDFRSTYLSRIRALEDKP